MNGLMVFKMYLNSLSQLNIQQNFASTKVKRVVSQATRDKISASLKGIVPSAETRKKISESLKGITRSEETRRKLSEAAKGRVLTPEHRANLSKAMKDVRKNKPEISQMHQDAQKLLWESEEGQSIKNAMHEQFEKQSVPAKKSIYKQIASKKKTSAEESTSRIFWDGFWKDNPDSLALYKEASKKAYEKLKKK